MRRSWVLLALIALPASAAALAPQESIESLVVRCTDLPPPAAEVPLDLACTPAIRPGARSNLCTLNFVVTDGADLYIGAAGHCSGVGARLSVAGLAGTLGTVVYRRNALLAGDWAFVRIDPEDRALVDPTMCRFGGPIEGPLGGVRTPLPGEPLVHYGHGVAFGSMEATRGRPGISLGSILSDDTFALVGSAAGGDSGSPVRLTTGEAAGILIAVALEPGYEPNLVVASRMDRALEAFSAFLGRPLTLVAGEPLPPLPPPPV